MDLGFIIKSNLYLSGADDNAFSVCIEKSRLFCIEDLLFLKKIITFLISKERMVDAGTRVHWMDVQG